MKEFIVEENVYKIPNNYIPDFSDFIEQLQLLSRKYRPDLFDELDMKFSEFKFAD